jgi:hypothetical protein
MTTKNDTPLSAEVPPPVESMGGRMVWLMRLVLALSARAVIYIDPAEPDRMVGVTHAAIVLYSVYSGALWLLSARRP